VTRQPSAKASPMDSTDIVKALEFPVAART